jgi:dTDP-4-amino-4,6-dideoxygalactose transaminase
MSMASEFAPPADGAASSGELEIAGPILGEDERRAVLEVLAGTHLVKGPRVAAFEHAFAAFHGARHAVATSSGSAALIAALMAHGIGAGDEVILPSFSFFATAASILLVGATPIFADIEPHSYCLAPDAVEVAITPRTKAIVPVHLFGMPADMPRLQTVARRHALLLLEDAAQAHGAAIDGRRVGTFGTAAFSFYATKNMTTLEGGMVLTDDADIARRLRLLRSHGREEGSTHELVGTNFRMHEVAAAIGLVQLGRLPLFTQARQRNARYLSARLTAVHPPVELPTREHVYHQYTVRVRGSGARDALVEHLASRGIRARVYYPLPIHRQPALVGRLGGQALDLPETERACSEVLSLPCHPGLHSGDLERIVRSVNTFRSEV